MKIWEGETEGMVEIRLLLVVLMWEILYLRQIPLPKKTEVFLRQMCSLLPQDYYLVLQLLANTEIDALLTKHQAKMVGYWPNKNEAKICKISPKHILNASQVNI